MLYKLKVECINVVATRSIMKAKKQSALQMLTVHNNDDESDRTSKQRQVCGTERRAFEVKIW